MLLSNHHGEPTLVTPGFGSAYSLGCTGACSGNCTSCSCGQTFTPPSLPKPTGPPTPDLPCGNQGFNFVIYPNNKADGTTNYYEAGPDPTYSTFDPQLFKTAATEVTGKTKSVSILDTIDIYVIKRAQSLYVTINHKGYLFTQ